MNIEHILNEVERERRNVIVSKILGFYEKRLDSNGWRDMDQTVEVLKMLASFKPDKVLKLCKDVFSSDILTHLKSSAAEILGALAPVIPDEVVLLYDEELLYTAKELYALASVRPNKSIQLSQKALDHDDMPVRRSAAIGLETLTPLIAYSDLSDTPLRFNPAPDSDNIRHFVIGAKRRSSIMSKVPDATRKAHHFEHTLFHQLFQQKITYIS